MRNRIFGKLTKSALALVVAVSFSVVSVGLGAPATAAAPGSETISSSPIGSIGGQGVQGETTTFTSPSPSQNELDESRAYIASERAKDVASFDRKVQIINNSEAAMEYILSFEGAEAGLQVDALAASMPEDALTGFTDMLDNGVLAFEVAAKSDGSYTTTMSVNEPTVDSGGMTTYGLGSLPQCPSAWAAFWAWFAVNGAMCGALGPIPAAAFACAVGYAAGGLIIDFNAGCK